MKLIQFLVVVVVVVVCAQVSQAAPVSLKQERKFTVHMLGTCAVLRPWRRCTTTTTTTIGDGLVVESDADIVFLDQPLSPAEVESIEAPEAVADHNIRWRNISVVDSDEDDEVATALVHVSMTMMVVVMVTMLFCLQAYLVSVLSKSTPMSRPTRRTRAKRRFRKS